MKRVLFDWEEALLNLEGEHLDLKGEILHNLQEMWVPLPLCPQSPTLLTKTFGLLRFGHLNFGQ